MNKHTTGPWKIYGREPASCRIEAPRSANSCLVIVERVGGRRLGEQFDDYSEVEANARLIAAAPDLLSEHQDWSQKFGAALMAVMQEDYGPITELAMSMPFDFHENGSPTLRSAAIAKARGEA